MSARGDSKVRRFRTKAKPSPPPEIEDVQEAFCGCRRKNMVPLCDANPEVAAEWCYEKNCGWGPEDFSQGSNVRAWWRCSSNPDHVWKTSIWRRCGRSGKCIDCFGKNLHGRKVIPERSLAVLFPDIARDWHPTKNGKRTPHDVLAGSNEKVWWKCRKNYTHAWESAIKSRTNRGDGCKRCYEEQQLNLEDYPEILKLFDRKKNLNMNPRKLTTTVFLWWRCPKGPDHVWKAKFVNKSRFGCEFCRNKRVSITNSLQTLYPKVALQLHPTRNGKLTADKICAYTSKSVWWRCSYNPKHVWPAVVANRTRQESGCPQCYASRRSIINSKAMKKYHAKKKQYTA